MKALGFTTGEFGGKMVAQKLPDFGAEVFVLGGERQIHAASQSVERDSLRALAKLILRTCVPSQLHGSHTTLLARMAARI